jgi:hypothetical protein
MAESFAKKSENSTESQAPRGSDKVPKVFIQNLGGCNNDKKPAVI